MKRLNCFPKFGFGFGRGKKNIVAQWENYPQTPSEANDYPYQIIYREGRYSGITSLFCSTEPYILVPSPSDLKIKSSKLPIVILIFELENGEWVRHSQHVWGTLDNEAYLGWYIPYYNQVVKETNHDLLRNGVVYFAKTTT